VAYPFVAWLSKRSASLQTADAPSTRRPIFLLHPAHHDLEHIIRQRPAATPSPDSAMMAASLMMMP
jgi:hypothetical protein